MLRHVVWSRKPDGVVPGTTSVWCLQCIPLLCLSPPQTGQFLKELTFGKNSEECLLSQEEEFLSRAEVRVVCKRESVCSFFGVPPPNTCNSTIIQYVDWIKMNPMA